MGKLTIAELMETIFTADRNTEIVFCSDIGCRFGVNEVFFDLENNQLVLTMGAQK